MRIRPLRILRKMYSLTCKSKSWYSEEFVELKDQAANDYIYENLTKAYNQRNGFMISKFGTYELNATVRYFAVNNMGKLQLYSDFVKGLCNIYPEETLPRLCSNAGFFPYSEKLQDEFAKLVITDIPQIDILASYVRRESYLAELLSNAVKVNLNGYYAPYLWENPWSKFLKNKKVLVIHPFTDSIKYQYERRELLFDNKDVLPTFQSIDFVKAIQSIGSNENKYNFCTWFDALNYMKCEIDKKDYDVAIIGCGAYGMNLAAHVKRNQKIAIHLAGWTQMLFGIYGNRWLESQPEFKRFINANWIRPSKDEKPAFADNVENGCYW